MDEAQNHELLLRELLVKEKEKNDNLSRSCETYVRVPTSPYRTCGPKKYVVKLPMRFLDTGRISDKTSSAAQQLEDPLTTASSPGESVSPC